MLMKIDTSWLLMAIATVAMLSYMISLGLDVLMKGDGFGPFGNTLLISGGFFLTIYICNVRGITFSTLLEAVMAGIGGAFGILFVLTLAKGALNRI